MIGTRSQQMWKTPHKPYLTIGLGLIVFFVASYWALTSLPFFETRLGVGSQALVQQTAAHLSKLSGGISVGGFPPFQPPDNDPRYRNKINNQSYTAEEANYWLKEINNFLQQLVQKNPGMSLEQILAKMGLLPLEIEDFLGTLRAVYSFAESNLSYGVQPETVETLKSLMAILKVLPW